jgi:steroid 5-alpha reductase family enzyme
MSAPPLVLLPLGVMIFMAVVMSAGWVFQAAVKNGGWSDVFWTYGSGLAFALAAVAPLSGQSGPDVRQVMVACLAMIWALRLGAYVHKRVAGGPEDARYADFRRDWGKDFPRRMYQLMIVQAPASALLSVSVVAAARVPVAGLRWADALGALILAGAIIGEAVADGQMKAFKTNPANKGGVCDRGLWAWSRHPNYLFEALGWWAYPVIGLEIHRPESLVTLIAPAIMYVILRYGTGVPPLEAAMLRSRGEAFRRYQARVSVFWPRPPKAPATPDIAEPKAQDSSVMREFKS